MNFEDTRSLSPQTQQALRKRAVAAVVEQGRLQGQLAQDLGVTRPAVNRWVQRYRARGEKALAARKQARPSQPNWLATRWRQRPVSFETMPQSNCSCRMRCGPERRWGS